MRDGLVPVAGIGQKRRWAYIKYLLIAQKIVNEEEMTIGYLEAEQAPGGAKTQWQEDVL